MTRILCVLLAIAFSLLPLPAHAEIEKKSGLCQGSLCFVWWPKLPPLKGWHHDEEQSVAQNTNALAPDGSSFVDAETVIYVSAVFKPLVPGIKTLGDFIEDDQASVPDVSITPAPDLITADKQKIRTFLFKPRKSGTWERIGYGEENTDKDNQYYLVFSISSKSQNGLQKFMKDYENLVRLYKAAP